MGGSIITSWRCLAPYIYNQRLLRSDPNLLGYFEHAAAEIADFGVESLQTTLSLKTLPPDRIVFPSADQEGTPTTASDDRPGEFRNDRPGLDEPIQLTRWTPHIRAGSDVIAISPAGWLLNSIDVAASKAPEVVLVDTGKHVDDAPCVHTIPLETFFTLNPELLQSYAVQHPRGPLLDSGMQEAWIVKHIDFTNGTMTLDHEDSNDTVHTADVIRHNLDGLRRRTEVVTEHSRALLTSSGVWMSTGSPAHKSTELLREEFEIHAARLKAEIWDRDRNPKSR
jgi:hypothetical protein